MAIPGFQEMMYPVLQIYSDGKEYRPSEIEQRVADNMSIPEEDRQILLPSEVETVLRNRVNWAVYDLFRAGLLERKKRGYYHITDIGRKELGQTKEFSIQYLKKYKAFADFQRAKVPAAIIDNKQEEIPEEVADPETRMQTAFDEINRKLADDLLDALRQVKPIGFEKIVLTLFEKMGYGEAFETPRSHDGGIDGIINQDELGLDKIYFQAKRYAEANKVHEKEMRDFIGALASSSVSKGVFITTSSFDRKALESAAKVAGKVILTIDGEKLVKLCIKHNVGAKSRRSPYEIKEIDNDYLSDFIEV